MAQQFKIRLHDPVTREVFHSEPYAKEEEAAQRLAKIKKMDPQWCRFAEVVPVED